MSRKMTRDQKLAQEMAKKHGVLYESATDRAQRKENPAPKPPSKEALGSLVSAAEFVRNTPESAKRRKSHRAGEHESPEPGGFRSITQWTGGLR